MILEVAQLDVLPTRTDEFEGAFAEASAIISSAPGYLSHELQRCIETPRQYVLLVRWETLEDHTEGFRGSDGYQEWKRLLHHFYAPFPTVRHFEPVHRG
ncbi:MAG: antibiotic biosynthesis monooxygenase [Rubrobacter sp.]|nr:antibiotic biosynthesis monooxygenase [Rubrobacter sp.]